MPGRVRPQAMPPSRPFFYTRDSLCVLHVSHPLGWSTRWTTPAGMQARASHDCNIAEVRETARHPRGYVSAKCRGRSAPPVELVREADGRELRAHVDAREKLDVAAALEEIGPDRAEVGIAVFAPENDI